MGNVTSASACRSVLASTRIPIVDPEVIVCLDVTAASAVMGRTVKLNQVQQKALSVEGNGDCDFASFGYPASRCSLNGVSRMGIRVYLAPLLWTATKGLWC